MGFAIAIFLYIVMVPLVGMSLKAGRCHRDGLTWDEDTIEQDNAQLEFFRTRREL